MEGFQIPAWQRVILNGSRILIFIIRSDPDPYYLYGSGSGSEPFHKKKQKNKEKPYYILSLKTSVNVPTLSRY
jgi:hypothetical protein